MSIQCVRLSIFHNGRSIFPYPPANNLPSEAATAAGRNFVPDRQPATHKFFCTYDSDGPRSGVPPKKTNPVRSSRSRRSMRDVPKHTSQIIFDSARSKPSLRTQMCGRHGLNPCVDEVVEFTLKDRRASPCLTHKGKHELSVYLS